MRGLVKAVFVVGLLASACATPQRVEHPVVRMASFDLKCPKDQLGFMEIDEKTWGVEGCGKRARYVEICQRSGMYGLNQECQWIAN